MSETQSGPFRLDDLKRLVRNAGYQIYRTQSGHVLLAERVRDNLILDSGIAISPDPLSISVTVRAQMIHFPGQSLDRGREFADSLASAFLALGYARERADTVVIPDHNRPETVLDTVCEVIVRKGIGSEGLLAAEIQAALGLPRTSSEA